MEDGIPEAVLQLADGLAQRPGEDDQHRRSKEDERQHHLRSLSLGGRRRCFQVRLLVMAEMQTCLHPSSQTIQVRRKRWALCSIRNTKVTNPLPGEKQLVWGDSGIGKAIDEVYSFEREKASGS